MLFRTGEIARNRKGIQRYAKGRIGEHWDTQGCRGADYVFSAWLGSVLSDWQGRFVLVQLTPFMSCRPRKLTVGRSVYSGQLYKIVMCNSSAIYDLDISQVPVVLNIYCDIKSFRFDEAHLTMDNDTDNYDIVRDNYDTLYNYGIDDTRVPIKGVI